jgi:prolactin regulatory element-binding protein
LTCSGTPSGEIVIVNSTNMHIHTKIKKAHLGIITALAFSPDSRFGMIFFFLPKFTVYALFEGILVIIVGSVFRALASVSLDSSARVTVIEEKKNGMCIFHDFLI